MNEQPNQSIEERTEEYLANPAALQPAKALVRDLLATLEQAQQENALLSRGANDAFKERAWKAESALHRLREVAATVVICLFSDEEHHRHFMPCGADALRAELKGSAATSSEEEK